MPNNNCHSTSYISTATVPRILVRFILYSLMWYALAGSDMLSWIIGVPAVLLTTSLSLKLAASSRVNICFTGIIRFVPFFLYQSFHGATDVMRRALSFRQLLNPGLVSYTTLLPEGSARIFFINSISLLPGTLSAKLHGNKVVIHTLDLGLPVWRNIQRLEFQVALLMGCKTFKRKEEL